MAMAAAAVAEVDGSQWNYLLCFHFVQLTHRQCVCLCVCVCVLEALKLFVAGAYFRCGRSKSKAPCGLGVINKKASRAA